MMNVLCLLALLPIFTNGAGVYHQSFTSSHRVKIELQLGFSGKSPVTYMYPLGANSTRIIDIPMPDFDTSFDYTITMRHGISGNVLGQMHRTMNPAQGSVDESLSPQGITLTINSVYKCAENFYGPRCEQFCKSTSTNQHCDKNGQLQAIAPQTCSSNDTCLNGGICFVNGPKQFCVCDHGFEGEFCEKKKEETINANYFVIVFTVFTICLILFVAVCLTYRRRATRNDALQRGQNFDFPQLAKTDVVMVKKSEKEKEKQVFSVENDYTTEPIYSAIHLPKLPDFPPPMTPSWP